MPSDRPATHPVELLARGATVLVTGALGFIGSRVLETLLRAGVDAVGIDNGWSNGMSEASCRRVVEARGDRLNRMVHRRERAVLDVDLLDARATAAAIDAVRPTHVVHLAALSRQDLAAVDPGLALRSNVMLTGELLEHLARTGGLRRFVFVSSSMVYGHFEDRAASELHPCRPVEPYGASKLAGEVLVQAWSRRHGFEAVVVRPMAVYGPDDLHRRVVSRFVEDALGRVPLTLDGDGGALVDFTWVEDAADGIVRATAAPGVDGETFNLSGGDARTLLEVADIVRERVPGTTLTFRPAPEGRPRRGALDITKTRRELGYEPAVSLEEGITRMLRASGVHVPERTVAARPRAVALSRPVVGAEELSAVARALRSGWLTHGPENEAFERELAAFLGGGHALAVNSGASALELSLRAAGIRGEVLVPAFTFCASANAVVLAGATPVFVDVEDDRLGMEPAAARAAIGPRTEAILCVHYAGVPCRIDELAALAREKRLLLVEDAAQAAGAAVGGRRVGLLGDAGCFSFFPTKNMTTGEGGMLVSRDAALVARARALAGHGLIKGTAEREHDARPWTRRMVDVGHNFRMSALQAALGRAQLARLDESNRARVRLAARLTERLAGSGLVLPRPPSDTDCVHSMYVARARDVPRDELVLGLRSRGVEASVHYDRVVPAEQPYAARTAWHEGAFPTAERAAREVLSLPMHPSLTPADVQRIGAVVEDVLAELREPRA